MADPTDPIVELYRSIFASRRPPELPWIVRWSKTGTDPVCAAWWASKDDAYMRWFYEAVTSDRGKLVLSRCNLDGAYCPNVVSSCWTCCDKIRAIVRVPPTIAEVLACLERI